MTIPTTSRNKFYLFGYPIAHSASPAFHNEIFKQLGLTQHHYQNHETVHPENIDTDVKSDMLKLIRSPDFGGSSVTMPIKVTAIKYVDRLGPAAQEIGSINTIYLEEGEGDQPILVGENFDWLGVKNALVLSLPKAKQGLEAPFGVGKSAFIIGGGGTTRATVYALAQLKLSPIYLINRDASETRTIIESFPQYDLRELSSPEQWTAEHATSVALGVGAIPSFAPTTPAEENVYASATKIFDGHKEGDAPRPFLEMCYKPRKTIMYNIAAERGWTAITGIEAMIEQGFAQERAWLLNSVSSPWNDVRTELGEEVEAAARKHVREMDDIAPK